MINLYEYIWEKDGESGEENRDFSSLEDIKEFFKKLLDYPNHEGDCIYAPCSCGLCILQEYLDDYEDYCIEQGHIKSKR